MRKGDTGEGRDLEREEEYLCLSRGWQPSEEIHTHTHTHTKKDTHLHMHTHNRHLGRQADDKRPLPNGSMI